MLSGTQGVKGFARRFFVLAGRRCQLLHRFQSGGYVHTLAAQALHRVGTGLFYRFASFDGGFQRGLGRMGCGLQGGVRGVLCGIHHGVVARGLRTNELIAGAAHFGQRAFKFTPALGVGAAVLHRTQHARCQVERTGAHRQPDLALDGTVLGRRGTTVDQADHVHRQRKQHQHGQRGHAADDHSPPGGLVNKVTDSFEHDGWYLMQLESCATGVIVLIGGQNTGRLPARPTKRDRLQKAGNEARRMRV